MSGLAQYTELATLQIFLVTRPVPLGGGKHIVTFVHPLAIREPAAPSGNVQLSKHLQSSGGGGFLGGDGGGDGGNGGGNGGGIPGGDGGGDGGGGLGGGVMGGAGGL